jgi:release factor glutamine methyltransferase
MTDEVWTIQRILGSAEGYFREKKIDNPRLDAELLLARALGCERIRLYTHFDQPLSDDERTRYRELVKRRAAYEPVAYILGEREFFARTFLVSKAVLIPRPETEHLVEEALGWAERTGRTAPRVLDVGTGSGCLAVSLACEWPDAQVVAVDISEDALAVARANAEKHGVAGRVELRRGDLFATVGGERFDVVVSNPPYVETAARARLMPDVRDWEPAVALFAGSDGLEVVRRLCAEVVGHLEPGGLFACEFGHTHREAVSAMLDGVPELSQRRDIVDLQRHVRGVAAIRV